MENVLDGSVGVRTYAIDVNVSGTGIKLDVGQTGAVLTSIVLFLHENLHLVEAVERGAVSASIIVQRFEQPDEGHSTFVFDRFAHNRCLLCLKGMDFSSEGQDLPEANLSGNAGSDNRENRPGINLSEVLAL